LRAAKGCIEKGKAPRENLRNPDSDLQLLRYPSCNVSHLFFKCGINKIDNTRDNNTEIKLSLFGISRKNLCILITFRQYAIYIAETDFNLMQNSHARYFS
jgi:hypothetical protein